MAFSANRGRADRGKCVDMVESNQGLKNICIPIVYFPRREFCIEKPCLDNL